MKALVGLFILASSATAFAKNSYCIGNGSYTFEDSTYNYEINCSDVLASGEKSISDRIFLLLTQARRENLKTQVTSEVLSEGYSSLGQFKLGSDSFTYDLLVKSENGSVAPQQVCLVVGDEIQKCSSGTQLSMSMDGSKQSAQAILTNNGFTMESEIVTQSSPSLIWKIYSK